MRNHSLKGMRSSSAHELGYAISAFDIIPNLFYPFLLAVSSLFFIAVDGKKKA